MTAKYLIRLDDACHQMNHKNWTRIEKLLDRFKVRPIVAVVPDNKDPKLNFGSYDPDFWRKVQIWRDKGWAVALHGYQHTMHPTNVKLILPFYQRSEFAGLSYEDQARKLLKAWSLFIKNGVEPKIWVAPAHCFDELTLEAIRNNTNIRVVSDGIARGPFYQLGFFWIPQQLWKFEKKLSGLWTVCLHPSTMTEKDFQKLELSLSEYYEKTIAFNDRLLTKSSMTSLDRLYCWYFWRRLHFSKLLGIVSAVLRGIK
jgi:hypothetical protein